VQFVSLFFCSRCAGRWHERPSLTTTISSQVPLYLPSKCRVLVSHSTGEVSTRGVYCCLSSVFIHLMLPICSHPRICPHRFCSRFQVHTECECPRSHEHRFHQLCEKRHKRQERNTRVEQHHLQRRCCCSWPRKRHTGASRQRALTCICICVCASTSKSVSYPLESHTWICDCVSYYISGCVDACAHSCACMWLRHVSCSGVLCLYVCKCIYIYSVSLPVCVPLSRCVCVSVFLCPCVHSVPVSVPPSVSVSGACMTTEIEQKLSSRPDRLPTAKKHFEEAAGAFLEVCTLTHTHTYTHTHTHSRTHSLSHTHTHTRTHARARAHTHTYTHHDDGL